MGDSVTTILTTRLESKPHTVIDEHDSTHEINGLPELILSNHGLKSHCFARDAKPIEGKSGQTKESPAKGRVS